MNFIDAVKQVVAPIKTRVQLMVGRAVLKAVTDTGGIQTVQLNALADESMSEVPRVQEFGFTSNPPPDSDAIVVALGGSRESLVVIATDHKQFRIKNLPTGETAIYSSDGAVIYMRNGGEIQVVADSKVLVDAPDAEFTGNVKIAGNLDVTGNSTLVGPVVAQATVAAAGIVSGAGFTGPNGGPMSSSVNFTTSGNVSGGGTSLSALKAAHNGHVHPNPEGGNTGPANTNA